VTAPTVNSVGPVVGTPGGSNINAVITAPATIGVDDVLVLICLTNSTHFLTTLPSGWAHVTGSPVSSTNGTNDATLNVCWKRAVSGDVGASSYTFTLDAADYAEGAIVAVRSAINSGSPWDTGAGAPTFAHTSTAVTTAPAVSLTTQGADRLLINGAINQTGGSGWTASSGFTKDFDTTGGGSFSTCTGYHKAQAVAGATGNVQPVCPASGEMVNFLGALLPVGAGGGGSVALVLASPPFTWPRIVPPFIGASQPLGNPATSTRGPLVASTPWRPLLPPGATLSASRPLGNPAVPTPAPLVVSAPWSAKVPGALLFGPGAPAAVVSTAGTPLPLVVSPPFTWPHIPPVGITASQPLGNPASPTPGAIVVGTPWSAKVPGAWIGSNPPAAVIAAIATPSPLVAGPVFAWPFIPLAVLSASQPLGNPAVGTRSPLVVSTFTLAPVPGAKILAAPQASPSLVTAAPIVVSPRFSWIPMPSVRLPAVRTFGGVVAIRAGRMTSGSSSGGPASGAGNDMASGSSSTGEASRTTAAGFGSTTSSGGPVSDA